MKKKKKMQGMKGREEMGKRIGDGRNNGEQTSTLTDTHTHTLTHTHNTHTTDSHTKTVQRKFHGG